MKIDILAALSDSSGFSRSQRTIAEFMLDNHGKASHMTAARLAASVGVSEATVVRFAREIGFESYHDMRSALEDAARGRLTSLQRIAAARELLEDGDILSHVLTSDIEQIRATMETASRADFDAAVNSIVKARNIYIFGLRSSGALANFMGFYFNLLLENVHVVNESSSLEVFEQILRISEGDVFVALSFPRYSTRTIRAMHYAKDCGAVILGITDNAASPIAALSDVALFAKSDMVSFVDTLVAPLSLVNALIVAVSERSDADVYANFEKLETIWNEYGVYGAENK